MRGLLARVRATGDGPERVTVLANRHVMAAYAGYRAAARSRCTTCAPTAPGDGTPTRALAMAAAARRAAARRARRARAASTLVHYPVTVPIPRPRSRRS